MVRLARVLKANFHFVVHLVLHPQRPVVRQVRPVVGVKLRKQAWQLLVHQGLGALKNSCVGGVYKNDPARREVVHKMDMGAGFGLVYKEFGEVKHG